VAAAAFLGLGRALGEAIAVSQTIGAGTTINANLFQPGDTLASRIALQFPGALNKLHFASLFYLAVILLAIGVVCNLIAQWISRRFELQRAAAI
jgi:phosphate transport system permease protein